MPNEVGAPVLLHAGGSLTHPMDCWVGFALRAACSLQHGCAFTVSPARRGCYATHPAQGAACGNWPCVLLTVHEKPHCLLALVPAPDPAGSAVE
jgi:hypothetical protein